MNTASLLRSALVTSLGLALLSVPAQAHAPAAGSAGIGDPYWPMDGNGGIDVKSYSIANSYDFEQGRLSGRTKIDLTATTDLSSFSLDFVLPVKSVHVDGVRAKYATPGVHELRITPPTALAAGTEHTVQVRYAGIPRMHTYKKEMNWLANRHEVVTMNEPHMAAWWFSSNDHPSDKALVDIAITVPKGKEVIANGALLKKSSRGGLTTWHWRAEEPMSSYLAFFAAGDFTIERGVKDGLPWLIAVSQRLDGRDHRDSLRLMRKTPEVVSWLEEDLGEYPFSVVGGLTTSLEPGFALENQTRPTYPAVGPHFVSLVVHELAHQWFGDDVAVQRWRDIWLNEGFASFMEWRWEEDHGGPKANSMLDVLYSGMSVSTGFWRVPIADPGAERVFSQAVYQRGAMTLQALRNRIGEETFWLLIRTWLAEQAGGNATSEEFEALAERISGQDLKSFFTAWLRAPQKPARTAANGLG